MKRVEQRVTTVECQCDLKPLLLSRAAARTTAPHAQHTAQSAHTARGVHLVCPHARLLLLAPELESLAPQPAMAEAQCAPQTQRLLASAGTSDYTSLTALLSQISCGLGPVTQDDASAELVGHKSLPFLMLGPLMLALCLHAPPESQCPCAAVPCGDTSD